MIYYPSHEIYRYQKLPHAFQTLTTIVIELTSLCFTYARHKTHKSLLVSLIQYPYFWTIYSQSTFGQQNIGHFLYLLSYTPKLIQRNYKLSKIEKNGIIGIIFFSAAYLYPVDIGRKNSETQIQFRRSCFTRSKLQTEK